MFFTQPPFYLESIIYSGYKESWFYSLPFGQVVASMC